MKQAHLRHGLSLSYARFISWSESELRIAFPRDAGFHKAQIFGAGRAVVEKVLTEKFSRAVRLVEETQEAAIKAAGPSLAERSSQAKVVREKGIESKLHDHPALRSVLRVLGGTVEHIQVLDSAPKREGVEPEDDD